MPLIPSPTRVIGLFPNANARRTGKARREHCGLATWFTGSLNPPFTPVWAAKLASEFHGNLARADFISKLELNERELMGRPVFVPVVPFHHGMQDEHRVWAVHRCFPTRSQFVRRRGKVQEAVYAS